MSEPSAKGAEDSIRSSKVHQIPQKSALADRNLLRVEQM
jgi:hypothetical protein